MEAGHDEEESRPFLGKKKTKEVISLPLSLHASNFQKKKRPRFLIFPVIMEKKKGCSIGTPFLACYIFWHFWICPY